MKEIVENLTRLTDQILSNENLTVSVSKKLPAYTESDLNELLRGLEISFDNSIKKFFIEIGGLSIAWTIKKDKLKDKVPEEDIDFLGGSIQILNPLDMIMGKAGNKWKDVFWFENMEENKKKEHKDFKPFDFSNTELVSGFMLKGKNLPNEMYLYDSNDGIKNLNINLEVYIEKLLITKGYYYWQEFILNKSTEEYDRFVKYMPLLFSDFQIKNL